MLSALALAWLFVTMALACLLVVVMGVQRLRPVMRYRRIVGRWARPDVATRPALP